MNDFPDAERLVKRLVAQELILSFVPDAEQRPWRPVVRRLSRRTSSSSIGQPGMTVRDFRPWLIRGETEHGGKIPP
jgi:hypothetical protein